MDRVYVSLDLHLERVIDRFTRDRFKKKGQIRIVYPLNLNFLLLDSSTPSSPPKGFPIRDPWRNISSVERVHYSPAFFIRRVTKELDGYPGVERRVLSESIVHLRFPLFAFRQKF